MSGKQLDSPRIPFGKTTASLFSIDTRIPIYSILYASHKNKNKYGALTIEYKTLLRFLMNENLHFRLGIEKIDPST